jgi:hypothetical protein
VHRNNVAEFNDALNHHKHVSTQIKQIKSKVGSDSHRRRIARGGGRARGKGRTPPRQRLRSFLTFIVSFRIHEDSQ